MRTLILVTAVCLFTACANGRPRGGFGNDGGVDAELATMDADFVEDDASSSMDMSDVDMTEPLDSALAIDATMPGDDDASTPADAWVPVMDSDHDGVPDEVEGSVDSDGDGMPDYLDNDSDNDLIWDVHEALPVDTDLDTVPDRLDTDSDQDGIPDSTETGDTDIATPPIDTDRDGTPDFRDADSDGDGLGDADELTHGTNPVLADSDVDGVPDLIEVGACPAGDASCSHDATDPMSSPRTRGDFVFVMPHSMTPMPERDTLDFSTVLRRADIYFLMDNTGSMGGTIAALQAGISTRVMPDARAMIPEAWFGVGGFDDFPISTYGNLALTTDSLGVVHDAHFFQYSIMSSDAIAVQNAVNVYRVNGGNDGPESGVAALYALATRDTLGGYARFPSVAPPSCAAGLLGAACFRPDAVPIVVVMTDVDQHNSPTCASCAYTTSVPGGGPSYASTIAALSAINARVVGIATSSNANAFLTRLVTDTTLALGATGTAGSYVLSAPGGTGLTDAVASAIARASMVPLDVSARIVDLVDGAETVDAVAAFVERIETRTSAAAGHMCTTSFAVQDGVGIDADSYPDTFLDTTPGAQVCFDILTKVNTTVMQTAAPQLFRARINVVGDGFTPLDEREVYFLVPPLIEIKVDP